MSSVSSSAPHAGPAARAKTDGPLHGEVIPPAIRVINPERDPPSQAVATSPRFHMRLSTALMAGALVATLSGAAALEGYRWHLHAVVAKPGPTATALARLTKDMGDLKAVLASAHPDDKATALKKSVDQLRAELDGLRTAEVASTAQLAARIEAKSTAAAPAVADVVARLDRMDHDPRLADITSRLDRIERQVSAPAPTGSIASQAKAPAGQSVVSQTPPASPAASVAKPTRTAVLDNWIVRDVYSGIALVEGRSGSVREVVPGETLPGAGEVRSIQRRGRGWVVVTSRGIIDTETW